MVLTGQGDRLYEGLMRSDMTSFEDYYRLSFGAMGTVNDITYSCVSPSRARAFRSAVFEWLADFESRYSAFLPDSLICEINRQAGCSAVAVDDMTEELLALCDWYYWKTKGLFDASSGPLIKLWDYHRKREALPGPDEVRHTLSLVGWNKIERRRGFIKLPREGMMIDLGGIGKEYAVDRVTAMANAYGIDNILVSLGRDLRGVGGPPGEDMWRVGMERPDSTGRCWGGVYLEDRAVCCSGHYARNFMFNGVRYSHLLNPLTGYPAVPSCEAAWVLSPTCTEAGILASTAVMMEHAEAILLIGSEFGAEGCVWTKGARYETGRFRSYFIKQ